MLLLIWWMYDGYAWLTNAIATDRLRFRLLLIGGMGGFLVVALAIPEAYDGDGVAFGVGYLVVIALHAAMYVRGTSVSEVRAILRIVPFNLVAVGLVLAGGALGGGAQQALWTLTAILLWVTPWLTTVEGFVVSVAHFVERHGLVVIVALGESIVAIGVGAEFGLDAGVVTAAVIGIAIAAALWWLYFDVVALVAERRLTNATAGREQNAIARDSFSYLHLPMVAGIVLLALGLKKSLEHVGDPLHLVPAFALLGGVAVYLLAHVAFRWRIVHRFSLQRLVCAVVLAALIPLAVEVPALVTMAIVAALLAALIVYENARFAELRERLRHGLGHEAAAPEH
jgi:low temperature requirement protein LtrA